MITLDEIATLFNVDAGPDLVTSAHAAGLSLDQSSDRVAISLALVDQTTGEPTDRIVHIVVANEVAMELATLILKVGEANGWEKPEGEPTAFYSDDTKPS